MPSLYTPQGAGVVEEPVLNPAATAAIIVFSLLAITGGFYLLMRNGLLCHAAKIQRPTAPRKDVTAPRGPVGVGKNPVPQPGVGGAQGPRAPAPNTVVVPNAFNASLNAASGIRDFK
jgi:hypothetical protein